MMMMMMMMVVVVVVVVVVHGDSEKYIMTFPEYNKNIQGQLMEHRLADELHCSKLSTICSLDTL
jgi:hypothetical protein